MKLLVRSKEYMVLKQCKILFQLHAMISHSVDVTCVGLGPNTNLLSSLKQHVVELASNIGVLNTIQSAAQATLQAGWSILLPTADERAKTLSALLPSTGMGLDTQFYCISISLISCFIIIFVIRVKPSVKKILRIFSVFFTGSDPSTISAGHRFMTDLLVSSLMADGGLETALKAAFKGFYMCLFFDM